MLEFHLNECRSNLVVIDDVASVPDECLSDLVQRTTTSLSCADETMLESLGCRSKCLKSRLDAVYQFLKSA
ncbi:hypothetical protein Taro_038526 [Colocasia esculenta]|uniref:Uncharacterized protein n=1 Tax=Colocasia esculenta TaxID=4460 RepID=A0A843WJI3_COLES|nr:hypothetical protein [Colocasia esculenta]